MHRGVMEVNKAFTVLTKEHKWPKQQHLGMQSTNLIFFSSLNRTEIFLLESKVLLRITKVLFRYNPCIKCI